MTSYYRPFTMSPFAIIVGIWWSSHCLQQLLPPSWCSASTLPLTFVDAFVVVSHQNGMVSARTNRPLGWQLAAKSTSSTNTKQKNNTIGETNRQQQRGQQSLSTTTTTSGRSSKIKESKRLIGLGATIKVGAVWDIYMEELIKYNQTHGHINVPGGSKEYPQLAKFLHTVRQFKGRLTKVQRVTLDNLGFLWKDAKIVKDQQKWLEMFERLEQYKNEFGDCKVPQNYTGGQKPSLGWWVKSQRQMYKDRILEKERIVLLQSIGFVWKLRSRGGRTPDDKLWEQRFQELKIFKLQFNHTNVPRKYKENKALGGWVPRQRELLVKGKLRDNRKQQLEEIDFLWNFDKIRNSRWQVQFAKLKQHIETYGRDAPIHDPELTHWAAEQRLKNEKGTFRKKQRDMLDKIGFNWDPKRSVNKMEDLVRNEQDSSRRTR